MSTWEITDCSNLAKFRAAVKAALAESTARVTVLSDTIRTGVPSR